jgi:hypothetical protein
MFEQVTESIGNFLGKIFGSQNERVLKRLWTIVNEQIVPLPPRFEAMSDADLRAMTDAFRARLAKGDSPDDILPEAFSAVREASRHTIGLRHYDVQLLGGIVLHRGMIAEMATGEGKTLVATSAVYLNALAALSNLDPTLEEAAINLGATGAKRFRRVVLPLITPGLFAGGTIVFIWSFTELGTPLLLNFNRVTPVQVFLGSREIGREFLCPDRDRRSRGRRADCGSTEDDRRSF